MICILSFAIFHPHFVIRTFASAFYHPHFIICIFPSAFFLPHFVILIFPSAFCHAPSAIRHPDRVSYRPDMFPCDFPKKRGLTLCKSEVDWSGGSSRKVSHEWLSTLWENNKTNNRKNSPEDKTAANQWRRIELQVYVSCYTCGFISQVISRVISHNLQNFSFEIRKFSFRPA